MAILTILTLRLHQARQSARNGADHHILEDRRYPSYLRRAQLAAAEYLHKHACIDDTEDTQFLYIDELQEVLHAPRPLQELIQRRRRHYRRQQRLRMPQHFGSPPVQTPADGRPASKAITTIRGLAAYRETVDGIVHCGAPEHLPADRILLLTNRFHDYYHLLSRVRAIITTMGSPFEHIGILAREMGIPILYQAEGAEHLLRDGMHVRMHADGSVELRDAARVDGWQHDDGLIADSALQR